jgi:hypothetical protein
MIQFSSSIFEGSGHAKWLGGLPALSSCVSVEVGVFELGTARAKTPQYECILHCRVIPWPSSIETYFESYESFHTRWVIITLVQPSCHYHLMGGLRGTKDVNTPAAGSQGSNLKAQRQPVFTTSLHTPDINKSTTINISRESVHLSCHGFFSRYYKKRWKGRKMMKNSCSLIIVWFCLGPR